MAKKRVRVIDQLQAVALATRYLITRVRSSALRDRSVPAVAAAVGAAGVPRRAPKRAVLSLLGVLVALSGAFDWAGRLLRLAGQLRCPDRGAIQSFADVLPLGGAKV